MIKVTFSQDYESGSIMMKMSGHAGSNDEGKDLICAGASTLAYTLAQVVNFAFTEGGKLQKKPNVQLDKGKAYIVAKPTMDAYGEILHAFFVIQVGMHLLAENYPEFVTLNPFLGSSNED